MPSLKNVVLRYWSFEGASQSERIAFQAALLASLYVLAQFFLSQLGWLFFSSPNPWSIAFQSCLSNVAACSSFLSTVVVLWHRRRVTRGWSEALMAGLFLEILLAWARTSLVPGQPAWQVLGIGIGLSAWCALALDCALKPHSSRPVSQGYLILATYLPFGVLFGQWSLYWLTSFTIKTRDLFGYVLDCALGWENFQPVYFAVQWMGERIPVALFVFFIYSYLGPLILCACVAELRHSSRCPVWPVAATVLAGAMAPFLYLLYPMTGYPFWNSHFPQGPAPVPPSDPFWLSVTPLQVRNAMPSLHATWILLCYFTVYRINWKWAVASIICVIGTLAGTLAVGHYLVDLVMAAPYTLFILALTSKAPQPYKGRALALAITLLVLGYIGLLHQVQFWRHHPGAFKWSCLALLATSWMGERYLAKHYFRSQQIETSQT